MHIRLMALFIIGSLVLGGSDNSFARKPTMSEGEFTGFVLSALQKKFPQINFKTAKPLSIESRDKKGSSAVISLSNSYPAYIANVANIDKIVEGHISGVKLGSKADGVIKLGNILPVIKPKGYFEAMKQKLVEQQKKTSKLPIIYKKLGDDLYQFYVFNTPKAMRFVMREDLKTLKLTADSLEKRALANLVTYFKKSRAHFRTLPREDQGKIYYFAAKETYEASGLLLLNEQLWNAQKIDVKGQAVVFVPARNVLLVTGSEDKKGLKNATDMSLNFYKNYGYGITPHAMIYKNALWQRFKP